MDAFVLDCHPDPVANEMVLWLKNRDTGQPFSRRYDMAATFYAAPRDDEQGLADLEAMLDEVPQVMHERVERLRSLDTNPSTVLQARVHTLNTFHSLARAVDRLGEHQAYDVYDVDLGLSHQFLLEHELFPFANVHVGDTVDAVDGQWDLSYEPPALSYAELTATTSAPSDRVDRHTDPIAKVRLSTASDERVFDGPESHILAELNEALATVDPDVLLTERGDRFLVRYLHHRAREAGVDLQLGRARDPDEPLRWGSSYSSYGQIKYQPRVEVLHGRLHVDKRDSFFYDEAGFWGLVDLSRITSTPLQELARVGAGTAVTAIQIDRAKREGRLVPWKKNFPEEPKTEHTLVKADRGGFIFDPDVGVFENVVELDFASMYPNIMVTRNVSPETILCDCCDPDDEGVQRVPQVGYHTCQDSGFIGRALEPLIDRRERFKRLRGEHPEERDRYQAAVDAIKWLAVCSFGYQGYKNARFGRIECHEAICAWGREILLTCSEIAREEGFEIVHGIVDSVWVQPVEDWADPQRLARRVTEALDIELEVEGTYDWIVFLPTRSYALGLEPEAEDEVEAAGALNRFYGCFATPPDAPSRSQAGQEVDYIEQGRVKVRGVELRQRSCPGVVQRAQEEVLRELARARDREGFRERLPHALDRVEPVLDDLRAGRVGSEDLMITKRVSRRAEDYRSRTDTWAALSQLEQAGVDVPPGDFVRFVVTDDGATAPEHRLVETRCMDGEPGYDHDHYETLILRGLESLLLPLGWDQERLGDRFARVDEPTLWRFA
jgi:DNA polymerase elongation subunit (family B)